MDVVYYQTLTPLVLGYAPYAGALFTAAFVVHWVRGAYAGGVQGRFQDGFNWWKTAILSLLVFTVFYVPVPHPGRLIGLGNEVDLADTAFPQTTTAIFVMERLSYGFDQLSVDLIGWDVSLKGQDDLKLETAVSGTGKLPTEVAHAPEAVHNFIRVRGAFLQTLLKQAWQTDDLAQKGAVADRETGALGAFDLMELFSEGQLDAYLKRQFSAMVYNLGSLVMILVVWGLMVVLVLAMYLLAGLVKYVPVLLAGMFLFLFPMGWMIHGRKALGHIFGLVLVYLPLKTAIVLVVWLTFFVVEGVVIQGYLDMAYGNSILVAQIDQLDTGFLYTPAGLEWIQAREAQAGLRNGIGQLGVTLVSVLVALLAMIYVVFKAPSVVSVMLGRPGAADDMVSSMSMLATAIYTGGVSLMTRMLGGDDSPPNTVQGGKGGSP